MTGIILQGQALAIVNKGGGRKCRTEKIGGGKSRMLIGPKEKGTDYIVFNCPAPDCGARNKRSAYECKGRSGNSLSFKCNKCYREIEVAHPLNTRIILDPNSAAQSSGILGPDGRPVGG